MHFVTAKGLLSAQNGMNLYRGCTHGCIYCDSRSRCYQMTHEFEDVEVKKNAPELLRLALSRKRKRCMISTGAMSDPYLPLEKTLGLTKSCLEIIAEYEFGLAIQTKSADILRDLELLKTINRKAKCVVEMTLTTYDETLCRIVEPYVSTTQERLEALRIFHENGIPTVIWLTPILPFLNDTEENLRGLLDGYIKSGVYGILCPGFGVTLREGNREYFYEKLSEHFPGLQERYQHQFGFSYECRSPRNGRLSEILRENCQKKGILLEWESVFSYLREFPHETDGQISFFSG